MATTAAPTLFPVFRRGKDKFVDAAVFGHNDPSPILSWEVRRPNYHIREAMVVNIGTGTHSQSELPSLRIRQLVRLAAKALTNTNATKSISEHMYGDSYFSFDFDTTPHRISSSDYAKIPELKGLVDKQFGDKDTKWKLAQLVKRYISVATGEYKCPEVPCNNTGKCILRQVYYGAFPE